MRTIFALFLFFVSCTSVAFEYHGIKSGMTREEVSSVLSDFGVEKSAKELRSISDVQFAGVDIMPFMIVFEFDYQEKLYALNLTYMTYDLQGINLVAFRQAIVEKFGATIEIINRNFEVTIIDEPMMRDNIQYRKQEYLNKI